MDIKKLNEELQKYIINELDKSSMDNAFYRRFDNYINSQNTDDKQVNWDKLEKHKKLRDLRDQKIGKIKNDFASLFGQDLTGQTYNKSIKINSIGAYKDIQSLKGLPKVLNGDLILDNLSNLKNLEYLPEKINGTLTMDGIRFDNNLTSVMADTFEIKGGISPDKTSLENFPHFKNLILFNRFPSENYFTKSIGYVSGNLDVSGYCCFEVPVAKKVQGDCKISAQWVKYAPEQVLGDVKIIISDNFNECPLNYVGGDLIITPRYNPFTSKNLQGLENVDVKGKIKLSGVKFTKALYLQAQKLGLLDKIEGIDSFKKEPEELTPEQTVTKEFFNFCQSQNIKASYDLFDKKVIVKIKGFPIKIQFKDSSKEIVSGRENLILGNFYFPGQREVWIGKGPYNLARFTVDLNNSNREQDYKKGLEYITSIVDEKLKNKKK